MKKFFAIATFACMAFSSQLAAETLTIQGSNLNLIYNSALNAIYDSAAANAPAGNLSEADQVQGVTFTLLPSNAVISLGLAPYYVDMGLFLSGPIAIGGGTVDINAGYFAILNADSTGISMQINSGTVTFGPAGVNVNMTGSATLCGFCTPSANSFPFDAPFTVSFSSSNITDGIVPQEGFLGDKSILASFDVTGTSNVPEPSTYALIGGSLLGLGFLRRRKA